MNKEQIIEEIDRQCDIITKTWAIIEKEIEIKQKEIDWMIRTKVILFDLRNMVEWND